MRKPSGTDGVILFILDFIPTFVRVEMAGLARRGRKVRVSMCGRSALWDGITGLDLPPGVEWSYEARMDWHRIPALVLPFTIAARLGRLIARDPRRFLAVAAESRRQGCFRYFLSGAELAGRLAADPPDRILCHFAWDAAALGMWTARMLDIPYTAYVHAQDIFVARSPERVAAILSASEPPITASHFNVAYIARKWGEAVASRIVPLHLGIDIDALPASREPEQPPLIFCTASGLAEKKGVHVLLEACELLSRKRSGWRCVVAGADEKGLILERYRALVRRKGLQGFVEFPGAMRSADLLEAAASSSVFVLPCVEAADGDMDAAPVSLSEAMAMGLPVISTFVSAVPELVENGVSGILTEPGDAPALAAAITRMLDDRETAARMGRAARERIRSRFSLARHVDLLEKAWAGSAPEPAGQEPGSNPD